MKNLLITLCLVSLVNSLCGQDKPIIMASASMWADMTETLAGDLVEVQTIVPIGGDPHIYDPTPDDARRVQKAQVIFLNGLTFEGWIEELIQNSGTQAQVVKITDGVQPISSSSYQNSFDPHAWMDLRLGLIYVENIYKTLVQLLPEQEDVLTYNFKLYQQQIRDLDDYCKKQILSIPEEQRILITSHDAFQYYGRRYGIQLEAVLGTSTDADVQTSDVRKIEQLLQKKPIPAIFIESTINPKLLQQLADDNNIVIGGQLYADSLGDEKSPANTYLNMLKHNTDVITEALKKSRRSMDSSESSTNYWWLVAIAAALLLLVVVMLKRKA